MKKLSSVFFMWMGFGLAIVATLAMFIPFMEVRAASKAACDLFFDNGPYAGAWPVFVGYMLVLFGGIALGVMALPVLQPSAKTEKIVLISAGSAIALGAILISLASVFLVAFNKLYSFGNGAIGLFLPGWYITVIFAIGAVVMQAIATKLDW